MEVSLSLQGKQLKVFVANNKRQAFQGKSEFGEICIRDYILPKLEDCVRAGRRY